MTDTQTQRTLATFNVVILTPEPMEVSAFKMADQDKRVLSNLPAMLEAVEEDLTSLLPEGYSAVIRSWDEED